MFNNIQQPLLRTSMPVELENPEKKINLERIAISSARNHPYLSNQYVFGGKTRLTTRDALLAERGGGFSGRALDLYLNLMNDSEVQASLSKQLAEICSKELRVIPASEDQIDVDLAGFVEEQIKGLGVYAADAYRGKAVLEADQDIDLLTKNFGMSTILGLTCAEVVWKKANNGRTIPDYIKVVDPRRIQFVEDRNRKIYPKLLTDRRLFEGIYLPPRKFIIHRSYMSPSSDPYGFGLGRVLYWLVAWKREVLSYWLTILDKHSSPTIVGTVPQGTSEPDFCIFFEELQQMAQDGTIALRSGYTVNSFNANTDKSEMLKDLIDYCDEQIRMIITGETTVGSSSAGGSQARDKVANSVRVLRAEELSRSINTTLERTLVSWLAALNFPAHAKMPKLIRNFQSKTETIETIEKLANIGYAPPIDWLETEFGIPLGKIEPPQV